MVRHARVARYGSVLTAARRKSVFDRMSLFRRSIWDSNEAAPVAAPASEPVQHDGQLSQARFDGGAALVAPLASEPVHHDGEFSQAPPVAPQASEPMHHDGELSQARFDSSLDSDTARQRSSRDSFIQDAREAQKRQSVRLDRPGRLTVNRPSRHPERESELEGAFAV